MNKIQKLQSLIIVILIVVIGYLFYQIAKLKEQVALNSDIIYSHQYSIDLSKKRVNDLHGITSRIIEVTGIKVNNKITLDPYNN